MRISFFPPTCATYSQCSEFRVVIVFERGRNGMQLKLGDQCVGSLCSLPTKVCLKNVKYSILSDIKVLFLEDRN